MRLIVFFYKLDISVCLAIQLSGFAKENRISGIQ